MKYLILLLTILNISSANNLIKPDQKKHIVTVAEAQIDKADAKKIKNLKKTLNAAASHGLVEIPFNKKQLLKLIETPNNIFSADKYKLGKMLYFEPRLSSNKLFSCNSCHNLNIIGTDMREHSFGDKENLNTPTIYNAVFNKKQLWDGKVDSIEKQILISLLSAQEMNSNQENIKQFINGNSTYLKKFRIIENNSSYEPDIKDVIKVISVYVRTLITPSKYDAYLSNNGILKGDYIYTTQEEKGLNEFINLGCVNCHSGINLGGEMNIFPVYGKYKYQSKHGFEGNKNNLIKVPTLRNVLLTAPYYHNGKVKTIDEAIYLMAKLQLDENITKEDISNIKSFLKTLNGIRTVQKQSLLPIN